VRIGGVPAAIADGVWRDDAERLMAIQSDNPPQHFALGDWKGLNQQARRGSIDDQEEFWNENLFAVGPGNLRSCWGHGPAIYTAPAGTSILRVFFGFTGNTTPQFQKPPPGRLGWMFLSDGTIDEVDLDTKAVRHVGAAWQPIAPQYWASAKVWRPQFFASQAGQQGGVLFGSPKGLYAWDGTTLSKPGDQAPDWLTDSAETTGTTFTMPSGLPGIYAMEVYQSRLFVAGKDVISFSAPSNGADFSTADGGGSFGYFGDKLTYSYMDLCASAGYLYVYGDSSIDLIANVQLSGQGTPEAPFTTNMNYENIDPQVGQRFPRPVGRIGRYMQMYTGAGIFECRGGEAREISLKLSNLYDTMDTSLYLPTMCPATMFGTRVLLCNGRFTDPFGVTRNLLLMWHPRHETQFWSVASQNLELTNIGAFEMDSIITPYGTDGTSLYQLFAAPDPLLIKKFSSKYVRGNALSQLTIKNFKRMYMEYYDNHGSGVSFTGTFTSSAGGVVGGVEDVGFTMQGGKRYQMEPQAISGAGIAGAIDLESLSPDFTIERIHVLSEERTLWGA
jgi:hypothetical protein